MTDNRTTELLCELLDERGVKWWEGEDERKTHWEANGLTWEYFNDENGDAWLGFLGVCESDVTPEQAIAATLGSERVAELEAENERLRKAGYEIGYHDAMKAAKRGGTLTAEQVRETVEKHWHDLSDEYDMPEASALPEYSYDWQAIADELNAELGSGTCEQVLTDCDDGLMPPFTAHCGACGVEWGFTPKYCHNCGAKCTGTRGERKVVD